MKSNTTDLLRHGLSAILTVSLVFGWMYNAIAQNMASEAQPAFNPSAAVYNAPVNGDQTATDESDVVPVSGYVPVALPGGEVPSTGEVVLPGAAQAPALATDSALQIATPQGAPATMNYALPQGQAQGMQTAPGYGAPTAMPNYGISVEAPTTAVPAPADASAQTPSSVLQAAPSVPANAAPQTMDPAADAAPATTAPITDAPSTAYPAQNESVTEVPASAYAESAPVQPQSVAVDTTGDHQMNRMPNGMLTSPGYPRENYDDSKLDASHTPEFQHGAPQSKEDMLPERVGQNPPLEPYPQQEAYSYFTESATSASTVCQYCGEGYGNPYMWMVDLNVRVMHRLRERKAQTMVYDYGYDSTSGTTQLCNIIAPNASFDVAPGVDIGLTRYLGRNAFNYDIWAELSFDGLHKWTAHQDIAPTGFFESIYGVAGLNTTSYSYVPEGSSEAVDCVSYSQDLDADYRSYWNEGEFMFRFRKRGRKDPLICNPNGRWTRECQSGPRYTHLAGVRFIAYNEDLTLAGFGNRYVEGSYVSSNDIIGVVDIETRNNLLGLSLGGEFIDKHCVWSWGFDWKVTPALNFIKAGITEASTYNNMYNYHTSDKTSLSCNCEVGALMRYKILPHWILSAEYKFNIVTNLALAGHNGTLQSNGQIVLEDNTYLYFQTLSVGSTFVW